MTGSVRGGVPAFHVMRVVEAAALRRAAGHPLYDLSAGQPSTRAPSTVLEAAHRALDADRLGYTPALGIPELRSAIARHYRKWYEVELSGASVAVTTGSSGAFLCAFLAAFDAGDTVVVTTPGYPAYRNMLAALGCRVVEVALGDDYRLSVAMLAALDEPPRGLVLASPANPTGTMLDADGLTAIAGWCDEHGVRLVSDEIYHGIAYGTRGTCAWQTSRSAIVVNSFSKYFSMTGWRLGWLLVPEELLGAADRIAGNFALCPPALSQRAALGAFDAYAELDANVVRYRTNRDLLTDRLPEIGIERFAPVDGAFYVYADVSDRTGDSLSWCARLLAETGVAIAPGLDFDTVRGGSHVRLCFAGDTAEIGRALDVMGDWLATS